MKAVFDTNILIDYLNGEEQAKSEIMSYDSKYISIISYIEVLVGINNLGIQSEVKKWLSSFQIIDVSLDVAEKAISIRKRYKLKVPDALIFASAHEIGAVLVTRNTKDFSSEIPLVHVPYKK